MSTHKYLSLDQLTKKKQMCELRPRYVSQVATTPCSVSLKSQVLQVYNQGSEGSCTANAYCMAYRMLNPDKSFNPSRQYCYWKERLIATSNNPDHVTDSGANVEDGIKWVSENGICSESSWPYTPTTVNTPPPPACDVEAVGHKLGRLTDIPVGNVNLIKQALVNVTPVLIAFGVYSNFEGTFTSKTGIVTMPTTSDMFLGGHEILIVGYHDFPGYFTCLNSWGSGWGNGGYAYFPYNFVSDNKLVYQLACLV